MLNYILVLVITIYVFAVSKSYYKRQGTTQRLLVVLLFAIHFAAMGLAYKSAVDFPENDAFSYYKNASNADSWFSLFGLGSSFFTFLIYPLVQAGLSLFVCFLLFASISYQTFLWYFNQLSHDGSKEVTIYGLPLTQLLFLLPSLHYWSGFLGKDVLVFFFLTYLLFEFKNKSRLNLLHCVVLMLLLLLRPHVFLATFVASVIYCLTQKNISKSIKIKMSILSLTILGILVPILMFFVRMKTLTFDSISEKIYKLNVFAMQSGSGVSLMETSYLERIWLLLFRPLFYDAKSKDQYIISVENSIVLLFLLFMIMHFFTKKRSVYFENEVKFAFLAGSCILLMIATYIYNLGLASRMRLMFLPLFFYSLNQMVYFGYEKKS